MHNKSDDWQEKDKIAKIPLYGPNIVVKFDLWPAWAMSLSYFLGMVLALRRKVTIESFLRGTLIFFHRKRVDLIEG